MSSFLFIGLIAFNSSDDNSPRQQAPGAESCCAAKAKQDRYRLPLPFGQSSSQYDKLSRKLAV